MRPSILGRLAILTSSLFVVGSNSPVVAALSREITGDLRTSVSDIGLSVTAYSAVLAITAPLLASVLVRYQRGLVLATGLTAFALGTAISAVTGDPLLFQSARVLAGVGGGIIVATAGGLAPTLVPAGHHGVALGLVSIGFALPPVVALPVATMLAHATSWRIAILALAGFSVLLIPLVLLSFRRMPIPQAAGLRQLVTLMGDRGVRKCLALTFFAFGGIAVLVLFTAAFTDVARAGDPALLSLLYVVFGVSSMLGAWLGGSLMDRFSPRLVIACGLVAQLAGGSVLVSPAREQFSVVLALYLVCGFAASVTPVGIQLLLTRTASRATPPIELSIAMSAYSSTMYLGIAASPVSTWLAPTWGVVIYPLTSVVMFAVGVVILMFLPRRVDGASVRAELA